MRTIIAVTITGVFLAVVMPLAYRSGPQGEEARKLSSAEMKEVFGKACDCVDIEERDDCKTQAVVDGCSESTCGTEVSIGTGNKRNVCTTGNPNTKVCVDKGTVLCKKAYSSEGDGDAQYKMKCGDLGTCVSSDTSADWCTECNTGDAIPAHDSYAHDYRCGAERGRIPGCPQSDFQKTGEQPSNEF